MTNKFGVFSMTSKPDFVSDLHLFSVSKTHLFWVLKQHTLHSV